MTLVAVILPLTLLPMPQGLTDRQVYARCQAKLKGVARLQMEVHSLDKAGKYVAKQHTAWADSNRGYRIEGEAGWMTICDKKQVYERNSKGKVTVEDYDAWRLYNTLGFDIFPDESSPKLWGDKAEIVDFDKRSCYRLSPRYGESILADYTLYIDAITFLPAGFTERQMGEWSHTLAYRKIQLNPKLDPAKFKIPK
ncbi:MAG: hypothetical protein H7Y17_12350 [Chlorobia bacterium]|nr:hypothetical protein [Fimbriimonadaceae bacterium]